MVKSIQIIYRPASYTDIVFHKNSKRKLRFYARRSEKTPARVCNSMHRDENKTNKDWNKFDRFVRFD